MTCALFLVAPLQKRIIHIGRESQRDFVVNITPDGIDTKIIIPHLGTGFNPIVDYILIIWIFMIEKIFIEGT